MRECSWRSLIWLSSTILLTLAACTPQLDLSNRRPPCAAGYTPCDTTGTCVLTGSDSCPVQYMIRQGASVSIPLPGARADQVSVTTPSDLTSTVEAPADGSDAVLEVSAPHGTFVGTQTRDGVDRFVDIVTKLDGVPARHVRIAVSAIAVTTAGTGDDGTGTTDQPFKTFTHALSVARLGDTVAFGNGLDMDSSVTIPAGVILSGLDLTGLASGLDPTGLAQAPSPITTVSANLTLIGDAGFSNLQLAQRLHITAHDSHVGLNHVPCPLGVEVEASAQGSYLSISDPASVISASNGSDNALLVSADGANISISNGASVTECPNGDCAEVAQAEGQESPPALLMAGNGQVLTMNDSVVNNSVGTVAIEDTGTTNKELIVGSKMFGRVEILGGAANVQVQNSIFYSGQYHAAGIVFDGLSMNVSGSLFNTGGIEQNNPNGSVVVRTTRFEGFVDQGYDLLSGYADLGSASDPGLNTFEAPPIGGTVPTALFIESLAGLSNGMSVSSTTFNIPMPGPCEIRGPAKSPGLYWILNDVPIDFY
jgi:hypothetical protein